ncbi:MAG: hypothetical protein KDE33_07830 [Bacteroidetes bacterium]|nr:hypothetical protein [Bacteroidota bacterium]
MNVKIILVVTFLLVNLIAKSQNEKDFERAVDFCACKIAFAYTNQYSVKNPSSKEKISFEKNIKPKIENCDTNSALKYSDIINLLEQNNYQGFANKLLPVVNQAIASYQKTFSKEKAVNTILDEFYNNPTFETVITTYSDISKIKKELEAGLNSILADFPDNPIQQNTQIINDDLNDNFNAEVKRLEKLINNNKKNPFSLNWLSLVLIIIISALMFIYFKLKMEDIKKRLDRHREAISSLESKGTSNQSNFRTTTNYNQFEKSISRSISDMNDSISKLQNDVSILSQDKIVKTETKGIQQTAKIQEKKREVLFAPAPNNNGTFNASVVTSSENQSSSFYQFTLLDGFPQKAEFEFINSERAIKDALSSYELILKPVCKFNNALNQNAKRINTSKVGIVERQNDKWVVIDKAEITYE